MIKIKNTSTGEIFVVYNLKWKSENIAMPDCFQNMALFAQTYCDSCNNFFIAIGSNNRYLIDTQNIIL